MARAYQEIQAAAPTAIEVLWLRRPRPRQLPVQFLPAAVVPEPHPTLPELEWFARRSEPDKSDGQ